jgi:hypothetical protein
VETPAVIARGTSDGFIVARLSPLRSRPEWSDSEDRDVLRGDRPSTAKHPTTHRPAPLPDSRVPRNAGARVDGDSVVRTVVRACCYVAGMRTGVSFDGKSMIKALDAQRSSRDLDWNALADELWQQSRDLNAELSDHGLCPGALVRTAKRGTMSCQYALIILRWIRRAPEDFLTGPVVDVGDARLPNAGPDHRLRWNLGQLHAALDEHRRERNLTWVSLADELDCTPNRLTNLRNARLADMDLTMRVTQQVKQPAAMFIHAQRW